MPQAKASKITTLINALNDQSIRSNGMLKYSDNIINTLLKAQTAFLISKGFKDLDAFLVSPCYNTFISWSSAEIKSPQALYEYAIEKDELWDTEVASPDLSYSLNRLISGLAVSEPISRCAFALTLTKVLRTFSYAIPFRILLRLMFQKLGVSPLGPAQTSNTYDWLLGRICFLGCCVRAEVFREFKNSSVLNSLIIYVLDECIPARAVSSLGFATVLSELIDQAPKMLLLEKRILYQKYLEPGVIKSIDLLFILFALSSKLEFSSNDISVLYKNSLNTTIHTFVSESKESFIIHPIYKYLVKVLLSFSIDYFLSFWESIILSDFLTSKHYSRNCIALYVAQYSMEFCIDNPNIQNSKRIIEAIWRVKQNDSLKANSLHQLFRESIINKRSKLRFVGPNILETIFKLAESFPKDIARTFRDIQEENRHFWTFQPSSASRIWSSLMISLYIGTLSIEELLDILNQYSNLLEMEDIDFNKLPSLDFNLKLIFDYFIRNKKLIERPTLEGFTLKIWVLCIKLLTHNSIPEDFKLQLFNRFKHFLLSVFLYPSTSIRSLFYSSSENELVLNINLISQIYNLVPASENFSTQQFFTVNSKTPEYLSVQLLLLVTSFLYRISTMFFPKEKISENQILTVINDFSKILQELESPSSQADDISTVDRLIDMVIEVISLEFVLTKGPIMNIFFCFKDKLTLSTVDLLVQAIVSPLEEEEEISSDPGDSDINPETNEEDLIDFSRSMKENQIGLENMDNISSLENFDCGEEINDIPLESLTEAQMEQFETSFSCFFQKTFNNEKQDILNNIAFYSRIFSIISALIKYNLINSPETKYEIFQALNQWIMSRHPLKYTQYFSDFKKKVKSQMKSWKIRQPDNKV